MAERPVAYYHGNNTYSSLSRLQGAAKMQGAKRVIVFCCLTVLLPAFILLIPLYLRLKLFMDVYIPVAESDVLEINDGISSIFCQGHSLKMNSTFSAFQVEGSPKFSSKRRHLRLKKSMTLPDDTLEYWGFYLLKESTVNLSVCSRYEGASILVVKGEKQLPSCGLFGPKSKQTHLKQQRPEVKMILDSPAEVINPQNLDAENHGGEIDDELDEDQNIVEDISSRDFDKEGPRRRKRGVEGTVFIDRTGINHGNLTEQEDSISSFEASLFQCYEGLTIFSHEFLSSPNCTDVHFLNNVRHMSIEHKVVEDGYYYYIFYSDNDMVSNDLHAVFNIYKPTLHHSNHTDQAHRCINQTECNFNLTFFNSEDYRVMVEVPTRDGIEHEPDDVTILISSCIPRTNVYLIFPFVVFFCITTCAFI